MCYVLGDSTCKAKTGKKNPAVKKGRLRKQLPYLLGIHLVFLVVHWGPYRIPVDFELIRRKEDPNYRK